MTLLSPGAGSFRRRSITVDSADDTSVRLAAHVLSYSTLQGMLGGVEVFAAQARRPVEEVRDDIAKVKRRMRLRNRFIIDPQSTWMQRFDLAAAFGLLYTITVTPYEVGFLGLRWPPDGLFACNQLVNAIFIVDMCLYFVRPVRLNGVGDRGWIKDHREIAQRYLRSWFVVDFMSVLPFDSLAHLVSSIDAEQSASELSFIMLSRFLRLLRLLKLARILRATRIINRWDAKISISYAKRTLIQWTIILLASLHLFACTWGSVAWLAGSLRSPELEAQLELRMQTDSGCTGCVRGLDATADECATECLTECETEVLAGMLGMSIPFVKTSENWICREAAKGTIRVDSPADHYFHALSSWHADPSFSENTPEKVVNFVLFFLFEFVWALFTGTICGTIATLDPHSKLFKQRMDALNNFIHDTGVPDELSIRVRDYFRQSSELAKRRSYSELYESMSPGLRGEIIRQLSRRTLEAVWYFRDVADREPLFMVHLARKLEPSAIAARETIYYSQQLSVVTLGVAGRGGEMLCAGQYWGEDMIVTSLSLRDTRNSTAIVYLELMSLTISQLEEVLSAFPEAQAEIRRAAHRIAMKRAVMLIAGFIRVSKLRREFKQSVSTRSKEREAIFKEGTGPGRNGQVLGRSPSVARRAPLPPLFSPTSPQDTEGMSAEELKAKREHDLKELITTINGRLPWRDVNEEGEVVDEEGNLIGHTFGKPSEQISTVELQRQLLNDAKLAKQERVELKQRLSELSGNVESMASKLDQVLAKLTTQG